MGRGWEWALGRVGRLPQLPGWRVFGVLGDGVTDAAGKGDR